MNEGKPTKAKWWSRPRSSEDATDGDFELERPRPAHTTGTGGDGSDGFGGSDGGDFELERPAPIRVADEGDYELDRPVTETDVHTDADPYGGAGAGAGLHAGAGADSGGVDGDDGLTVAPVGERPKPLHDPDPYSTPPYGEPGPWAPAPPVQHPASTPAHGTVAAGPPASGVPAVPPQTPPPGAMPTPTFADAAPAGAVPDPALADAPPPAPPVRHPAATPVSAVPPQTPPLGAVAAPTFADAAPAGAVPDPALADAPPPAPPVTPVQGVTAAAVPHPAVGSPEAPVSSGTGGDSSGGVDPWGRYDPWAASAAAAPLQQNGAVAPTREQRRKRAGKLIVGGALLIALVSGGIGGALGTYLERNGGVGTVELPQAGKEAAERAPGSVAGIAARALPSVVTLHVSGGDAAGTGTGFVLDDRGHILTNNHVVEPAGSGGDITVTFNSGDTAEATVVGRDSGYDLAVVKVKGVSGLSPLPLGNSDNVRVGDPVVAIGAPFDLAGTVTSGIISAKERPITAGGEEGDGSDVSYVDALQTDAPINPGNSGGPLLDSRGRAIGINSAIRSAGSGGAESDGGQAGSIGLGFAIPINQGKRVAEELINTGKATHPVIGITLDMNYTGDGARVGAKGSDGGPAVTTGGPGAEAGIKPGDVITAVDGRRVHSGEELIVATRAHRPGDRLELTLERDGEETNVSLVLGSSGGD
ncbi:trypsin-like peptidase domain-containing protein [Streptomyces sp. NPDC056296]|uniref:trypsin-like peptidase domain-containing protein n=1 Tax=Streptomyces sp. NPDC056296 TaxID=3345775 RepID=UPI0035E0E3D8